MLNFRETNIGFNLVAMKSFKYKYKIVRRSQNTRWCFLVKTWLFWTNTWRRPSFISNSYLYLCLQIKNHKKGYKCWKIANKIILACKIFLIHISCMVTSNSFHSLAAVFCCTPVKPLRVKIKSCQAPLWKSPTSLITCSIPKLPLSYWLLLSALRQNPGESN